MSDCFVPQCALSRDLSDEALDLDLGRRFDEYVKLDYCGGRDLPEVVREIVGEGFRCPGDSGSPQDQPPPWYDGELFLEGQRCARNYQSGLAESEMLALFLLFSVPSGLDPLIATGKCVSWFKSCCSLSFSLVICISRATVALAGRTPWTRQASATSPRPCGCSPGTTRTRSTPRRSPGRTWSLCAACTPA